jgi:ankyrin repeat protein
MTFLSIWPSCIRLSTFSIVICLVGIPSAAFAGDVESLYKAAGDGDATQVSALLDKGVDVNGRTATGSFALNNAAVENHIEVIKMLLDRGADPNVQNIQGDTPLICATKYAGGKQATVKLLVDAGTDSAIKDDDGKTALDYAMEKGQKEAIALLENPGK